MSLYDLNFEIFVNEYLPPNKRAPIQKSWLNALMAPQQALHNDIFGTFYPDIIARSKQNGQKIIMEDVLNSVFNVSGPSFIYIDNTGDDKRPEVIFNEFEGYPPSILFNESEGQPAFFFINQSETVQSNDFKVYVPAATYSAFGEARIAAEIDRLRPYSTTYVIISY